MRSYRLDYELRDLEQYSPQQLTRKYWNILEHTKHTDKVQLTNWDSCKFHEYSLFLLATRTERWSRVNCGWGWVSQSSYALQDIHCQRYFHHIHACFLFIFLRLNSMIHCYFACKLSCVNRLSSWIISRLLILSNFWKFFLIN